ncbi:MAG: nitrate/nitrite transporter NrtS [Pseudomonadota bacterium]
MHAALERETVIRSLKVALIVGTALNLINQGDTLLNNEDFNLFKCLLTYAVPYCVATYGTVAALRSRQDRTE